MRNRWAGRVMITRSLIRCSPAPDRGQPGLVGRGASDPSAGWRRRPARRRTQASTTTSAERRLACMCRLFALHAGERDVAADFWLLDAPASIAHQSERNADGYGLAALTAGRGMIMMRNPVQASSDPTYSQMARRL